MCFEEHIRSTVGAATFDKLRQRKKRAWQTALNYFEEHVKRIVDPDDMSATFYVPSLVNDGEATEVEEGYLPMSATEVWKSLNPSSRAMSA